MIFSVKTFGFVIAFVGLAGCGNRDRLHKVDKPATTTHGESNQADTSQGSEKKPSWKKDNSGKSLISPEFRPARPLKIESKINLDGFKRPVGSVKPIGLILFRAAISGAGKSAIVIRNKPRADGEAIGWIDGGGIIGSDGINVCSWYFWFPQGKFDGHFVCGSVPEIKEEHEGIPVFETATEKSSQASLRWYRIIINPAGKLGWIHTKAPFTNLSNVLGSKTIMTYLTPKWDRLLYATPGGKAKRFQGKAREYSYRAEDQKVIDDQIWIKLNVVITPCDDGKPVRTIASGWVPAFDKKGDLQLWLYSRGC